MIHQDFSLPSSDLFQIPGYQEAESLRYGPDAFMILPLSSGRVAVLGHMRTLHAICDTLEEVREAGKTIPFLVWQRQDRDRVKVAKAPYTPPKGSSLPDLSLDDLGI